MSNTDQSRHSRFSNFPGLSSIPNGNDRPLQSLTNSFTYSSPGTWNTSGLGGVVRGRDVAAPRGPSAPEAQSRAEASGSAGYSGSNKGLVSGPSSSDALVTMSGADPWGSGSGVWNLTDTTQSRTLPASSSPRNRSDASVRDGNSTYSTAPATGIPRSLLGPKQNSLTAIDSMTAAFQGSSSLAQQYDVGLENLGMLGRPARQEPEHRRSGLLSSHTRLQELSFMTSPVGHPSRNSVSSHAAPELLGQTNPLGDSGSDLPADRSAHSQRPSLPGSLYNSLSLEPTPAPHPDEELLAGSLLRLGLGGGRTNGPAHNTSNGPAYGNGTQTQHFEFNPGPQPWGGGGQPYDAYANGPEFEKRGSIVDRSSPAGSTYRANGALNSPRGLTSSPQQNPDAWSRPASRDPRMSGSDVDRRALAHHLFQSPTPFFPGAPFYGPSYQAYAGQLFPPFGDLAHSAHMLDPCMSVPHYPVSAAGVAIVPARPDDPGKAFRSALLHEYKYGPKSSVKHWGLKDIAGHVVEFSSDQSGSRFIQEKLESANGDEKDQVFREIEPNAVPLMKDLFGNYVIQKFFEHGDQIQKKVLLRAMKGKVMDLSMQMYACRVVQKALENVLVEQQAELVKELEADVVKVATDPHGNHVVQQAIALVPRQHIGFIIGAFKGRVCELASQQYACRVIQRILEHGTEADKAAVTQELHKSAETLIKHPYGNYVIQHVLHHGRAEDRSKIIDVVMADLVALSKSKCASNVVEKCIAFGTREEQRAIWDRLVADGEDNCPLFQLAKDQYGNYVVQKLIALPVDQHKEALLQKLKAHLQSVRKAPGAGKQMTTIERVIAEVTKNLTPPAASPASPGLQVDIGSAAPTPNLTMDPNSPLSTPSSSVPYANGDGVEPVADHASGQPPEKGQEPATPCPQPQIGGDL